MSNSSDGSASTPPGTPRTARLYLSATHKSSGKTTLSIGIARALSKRGLRVQPFKKGPDYIDPMWLGIAAGRSCFNLDFHGMAPEEIRGEYAIRAATADVSLIEGNVGLFDSIDVRGAHSNAELVKLLDVPLILIVNAHGMGRGIVPLLLGYRAFDPDLRIAGVILNKVGGGRHAGNLRRAIEHYMDLPILGMLPRLESLDIAERHLGLVPSNEAEAAAAKVDAIARHVAAHLDLDLVLAIAGAAPPLPPVELSPPAPRAPRVRIGVAQDQAFGFYYPDDLAALRQAGAELLSFSPIADSEIPRADALLIGGGFPEFHMRALADNAGMRASIADFIDGGGPVYAECGGLMYLCRTLHWNDLKSPMCGVLDADVAMHERPRGRGYVRLRETAAFPWPAATPGRDILAHEFHHSALVAPDPDWVYAYDVLRGSGVDGQHDGIVKHRLLASYAHLRSVGGNAWTSRFVAHVQASLDDRG